MFQLSRQPGLTVSRQGSSASGPKLVGLHKNPSGQSTLAFDAKVKRAKKRRDREHEPPPMAGHSVRIALNNQT